MVIVTSGWARIQSFHIQIPVSVLDYLVACFFFFQDEPKCSRHNESNSVEFTSRPRKAIPEKDDKKRAHITCDAYEYKCVFARNRIQIKDYTIRQNVQYERYSISHRSNGFWELELL